MNNNPGGIQNKNSERRQFARIQVDLRIKFKSTSHFEHGLDASITNLSLGGMFISSKKIRPVGTHVEMEIPGKNGNILKIKGEVRSTPHRDGEPLGMGVMFVDLDGPAKKYIEHLVNKR